MLQGASTVRSSTSSYSLGGCSLSGSNEPDGTMVNISLDIPFAQVYGGSANFTIGGSVDIGLITR